MSGTNPPIITDGPVKAAALGGSGVLTGSVTTLSWLVWLGISIAVLGMLTVVYGTLQRHTNREWRQ